MSNNNARKNKYTTDPSISDPSCNDIQKPRIQEIFCNIRDSVVSISTQTLMSDQSVLIKNGNGFFIKGHYIICPYSVVCNDKSLPNVNKILVAVSNVNNMGKSYSYEAFIIGVDAAANIAILRIDNASNWNEKNIHLNVSHPVLHWGKSRNCSPGEKIFLIGETTGPDVIGMTDITISGVSENGIVVGNLSDNRYVSYGGYIPGELLLLSNIFVKGTQSGLPVINRNGSVIGMFLSTKKNSHVDVALSEFFMRRPVKAIIRASIDKKIPDNYRGFIESTEKYYIFNKSWLGIGGILVCQNDYNTFFNHDFTRSQILSGINSSPKEILGYRVLSIAPDISPVYDKIFPGDIITHINGCPIGDRKGQISPSLVMWRVRPYDTIKIRYLKQSETFNISHEIDVITCSYPSYYDFPWYAFNSSEFKNLVLPTLI